MDPTSRANPSAAAAAESTRRSRTLFAFDFDHTICQENTDAFILELLHGTLLPDDLLERRGDRCWTDHMQAIFVFLHQQGFTEQHIRQHMKRTPLVDGW